MSDYEVRADMFAVVEQAIIDHPRSQQRRIGPSGLGTPCDRKLALRLWEADAIRAESPPWRPTVGTAVHTWLTTAFNTANRHYPLTRPRWLTDIRVPVGTITNPDGEPMLIDGSLDLYDAYTMTIIDWKIPGPSSLKSKKSHGPGQEYVVQVHCYGKGAVSLGLPVETVGILFLPSSGELSEGHYWSQPYDVIVAERALQRAGALSSALHTQGLKNLLPLTATCNDYCNRCPWFVPGASNLALGCPGADDIKARTGDRFSDLIGA